jgi:SAM-dependent methyltransferase
MKARSLEPEILDVESPPQPELDRCYDYLKWVNRWLGGTRATISCFRRFARGWRPGERIRVLDVAAGAADVPRALVGWGREFRIEVTALDLDPGALDYAKRDGGELRYLCADVLRMPCREGAYDYVTCSLFFHHLADEQIVAVLRAFDGIARRGIVVNDLIRRWRAWAWIKLLTLWANPITKFDGPLSVRKSLTVREARGLVERAGLPYLEVRTHFGHRMTISGEKAGPDRRP